MQACKYGTMAEQARHRMGWLTAKQRPQCGNCKHLEEKVNNPDTLHVSTTYRCRKGDFATAKTAFCSEHQGNSSSCSFGVRLDGWIAHSVDMGRGDERYIGSPSGDGTTVRMASDSNLHERILFELAESLLGHPHKDSTHD